MKSIYVCSNSWYLLSDAKQNLTASGGTALHAPKYHLLPVDIRKPPADALASVLLPEGSAPRLSPDLPTLLLFECVLVYMKPEESDAVIRWFVDYLASSNSSPVLGGIVYEMFGLNDPFGKVMLNNLRVCHHTYTSTFIL